MMAARTTTTGTRWMVVVAGDSRGGCRGGIEGKEGTPLKCKGGRGKKPPTLVMHTMAGRNLNVRELMHHIM